MNLLKIKQRGRFLSGFAAIVGVALCCGLYLEAGEENNVPYPQCYRSWTFLHSSLVPPKLEGFWKRPCEKPCTAGIFHFYGNSKAMEGLRTGTYPDGAILAEEMLEFLGTESGGGREGGRRLVGVMVKDSKLYASTAGWGFGSYDEDSQVNKLTSAESKACFTCHISQKDHGYVFARYQER
jgi:Cytochrome P460